MTLEIFTLLLALLLAAAIGLAFYSARRRETETQEPPIPEFKPQPDRLQRRIKSTEIKWEI